MHKIVRRFLWIVYLANVACLLFSYPADSLMPAVPASDNMILVPAGSFKMGSPETEIIGIGVGNGAAKLDAQISSNEHPLHSVSLSSFLIGKYEITQKEWKDVMQENPSLYKGDDLPVEMVSWYDCLVYCNRRSLKESLMPCYSINGQTNPDAWGISGDDRSDIWDSATCDFRANGYRLPTEAEWEYACRAGTTTATPYGNNLSSNQANFDGSRPYNGAKVGPFLGRTVPVNSYEPNPWGLYCMIGNVYEWCWDWYKSNYYSSSQKVNPHGPTSSPIGDRILRGGSWYQSGGGILRSAYRNYGVPWYRGHGIDGDRHGIGLRVVRSVSSELNPEQ